MTMQDFQQASQYVYALTGESVETANIWWRCIHDQMKDVPAHKFYGTLPQLWQTLCDYNNNGYGIFCNINAFTKDTKNHNIADVWYNRVQVIDLDDPITSLQSYNSAIASNPAPSFAVGTSQNKFHIYWSMQPYQGTERYTSIQRKLRQVFNSDKNIIDPTRVLRVPGFAHCKGTPHAVQMWPLSGLGSPIAPDHIEQALAHVNVIDGAGRRHELGSLEMAAPSLDWLRFAISHIDPNELSRGDWISITAAFKQAGWTHADDTQLFEIWSAWCAKYEKNDLGENLKQWNSIRDTEVGWPSFKRRVPILKAYEAFGFKQDAPKPNEIIPQQINEQPTEIEEIFPDILNQYDQQRWFKNCIWVGQLGKILAANGRFMDATKFNGSYGGKLFIITPDGKTTDEPWKAATRSMLWTIPKVDHIRFCPEQPSFGIINDQLERKGINIYIPVKIKRMKGDVQPWLKHMSILLPNEQDRNIIYKYLAHNVKFPGFKIPWAPMIQSVEGGGKGFIATAMSKIIGEMYTHRPKAPELVKSGSVFNAWQRGKLMIFVDEIKIDERRELIEILKPMISDNRIEIQSKGIDQEMEDNPANWIFFSNYKDAVPITQSGRRYAIFYSALQTKEDKIKAGLTDAYFQGLFTWLENGGSAIIADWLLDYPIERGDIWMTAPETSSREEALRVSRGPIETAIMNAVNDGIAGFRGGYISVLAVANRIRQLGLGRIPSHATICRILETMGYFDVGRAPRQFGQESMTDRTTLYAILPGMNPAIFGKIQGYE